MRIKTKQNVSTAKSSKASEALGIFEPPISCLQDKRTNQYATEPCNRELSSTSLPDSYGEKQKEPMTIKSMQNVPRAKYSKIRGHWADSNHRSPNYETGALTTMLQSHAAQRGIKKYIH